MRATAPRMAPMSSAAVVAPQVALATALATIVGSIRTTAERPSRPRGWPHQSSDLQRETYLGAHPARMEATWSVSMVGVRGRCPWSVSEHDQLIVVPSREDDRCCPSAGPDAF
jgi:hypothetical protein